MVAPSIIHKFKDPYTEIAIVYKPYSLGSQQNRKIEYFSVYELDATVLLAVTALLEYLNAW